MELEQYKSIAEKSNDFFENIIIDDKNSLERKLEQLSQKEYMFRGVNNALYKMYSSSQRHWILKDQYYKVLQAQKYVDYIYNAINKVKGNKEIQQIFSEEIPINDGFALALLQHYAECSPFLDFTIDFKGALFFAQDGVDLSGNGYISLYYIDRNIDWMQSSLQSVIQSGAAKADQMVKDYVEKGNAMPDVSAVAQEISEMSLRGVFEGVSFIPIDGPNMGIYSIEMPFLKYKCCYNMSNPRIDSQRGLFILNTTPDKPLQEVMNEQIKHPIIGCLNIKKNLIPTICDLYLRPNNISSDTLYNSNSISKKIEYEIKSSLAMES